jgi:hypothetical protein
VSSRRLSIKSINIIASVELIAIVELVVNQQNRSSLFLQLTVLSQSSDVLNRLVDGHLRCL